MQITVTVNDGFVTEISFQPEIGRLVNLYLYAGNRAIFDGCYLIVSVQKPVDDFDRWSISVDRQGDISPDGPISYVEYDDG